MKKLSIIIVCLFLENFCWSQAVSNIESLEISKGVSVQCTSIQFDNLTKSELEVLAKNKFSSLGLYKEKKVLKSFKKFEGSEIISISSSKMDYYYQVVGEKKQSKIYLLMSTGYDNYLKNEVNPNEFENAKKFLETLNVDVANLKWQNRLDEQNEIIKKETKNLNNLEGDLKDLEKKLAETKSKIETTQNNIETQKNKINDENSKLKAIQAERK